MEKIPFKIIAEKKGKTAQIKIVGHIGWDIDSNAFQLTVENLVKEGCDNAYLYINSPGGSCFDANEIINILLDNFGDNISGDGGALVASAGSRISLICKTFEMPQNGQYMIHRPQGCACGDVIKMESYAKNLRDVDAEYLAAYQKRAVDTETLTKKWESGADYWLTASEAKEAGFITGVRGKVKIDAETKAMITSCASPIKPEDLIINDNNMKELAKLLKQPESATEQDLINVVSPVLTENVTLKADLQTEKDAKAALQAKLDAIELKEKQEKTATANTLIAAAIKDGRLDDDEKHTSTAFWLRNFENDFDGTKAMLDKLPKKQTVQNRLGDGGGPAESAWERRQREIDENNKKGGK